MTPNGHSPMWGPVRLSPDAVRFRLWAPSCDAVALELKGAAPQPMTRDADGWFQFDADAKPGRRYRFRLSPDLAVPDPAARVQAEGVHGWSVVVDPDAYVWRNANWRGRPWTEAVIYELHAGLCGGFKGVAERLPALTELGVTAVELMPVNTFSGARNWGYDGVLPYAPAASYGSSEDLKALVDRAHDLGLMILLDVVYNHFGPDGNYLPTFAGGFFDADRHTPWGDAIAFGREAVARFFIDNARMWIEEYRFDGLRLDAAHAIGDRAFLDRLAREVRAAAPDRHVHLVLENEANDPGRLGEWLYDAQWNDDFHNVVHVLLTGETQAYYRDFAERPAERLARCLAQGFVYQGEGSPCHDGRPRGAPSGHLAPSRFVAFLQNHDQVGNRALGERLTRLTTPAKLRAAVALLLLCPQIPLLFMGEEDGSETPFLFFTDFHDELAEAVREGRRREFATFPAFADPEQRQRIPDPNAVESFEASRVEPGPDAATWQAFHQTLLALRRERIIPGLDGARSAGAEALGDAAVVARWTMGGGVTLTLAVNFGDGAVPFTPPEAPPLFTCADGEAAGALPPASLFAWLG